ncbi:hypothetical protein [Tessaracoccus sp. OH4464_COT-324]|uniref:hypothetical protein n=1 Tax=Tessaracoccus sp. OH4464_COT-324 TaxID=2491059 RepID=UPI000F6310C2|nr:hypothetical protein [Tessaracoccus sp. OH4464_COT-324]RRD46981.1 hypothetical protein EII42_04635 [Tessaracoccus sp. OH4464_COT-324]
MDQFLLWLGAFGLTLVFEAATVFLIGLATRAHTRRWAPTLFLANLTHPVLWISLHFFGLTFWNIIIGEVLVALIECCVWRTATGHTHAPWALAAALGLISNAVSFGLGLLVS